MTKRITHGLAACAMAACIGTALAQESARVGTSSIAGRVVIDGGDHGPARRAIVTLRDAATTVVRHAVTNENGEFEFDGLPAGRFTLTSSRAGLVSLPYGASRPGRQGKFLVLPVGERLANVRLAMLRGAVIGGVIRGVDDLPMPDVQVVLMRRDERGYWAVITPSYRTDSHGSYRAFGLAPDAYLVSARGAGITGRPVRVSDDGARGQQASNTDPDRRVVTFAPTYYPGAYAAVDATPVELAPGEERLDVSFAVGFVPTLTVQGTAVSTSGSAISGVELVMSPDGEPGARSFAARTREDGNYRFVDVPPGRYTIVGRTAQSATSVGGESGSSVVGGPGAQFCASQEVLVGGTNLDGLSLVLQSCSRILGRVVMESDREGVVGDPRKVRVTVAVRAGRSGALGFVAPVRVSQPTVTLDGRFEGGGLAPGEYLLNATFADSSAAPGWWLRSLTIAGQDALDRPYVIKPGTAAVTAIATFSDAHTAVSGRVKVPPGTYAPDYLVVAFPTDRNNWLRGSRRLRSTRPDEDGRYELLDVPPGQYKLALLEDVPPEEWQRREFLAEIEAAAPSIALGVGEHVEQDLSPVIKVASFQLVHHERNSNETATKLVLCPARRTVRDMARGRRAPCVSAGVFLRRWTDQRDVVRRR